jgi:hypothetical protein
MTALEKYRPQWVYLRPQTVEEEPFDIPFSFTLLADGSLNLDLPIQLDNQEGDDEILLRGIFFNRSQDEALEAGTQDWPYFLARLRDTYGNPTSDTLTLALHGWANPSGAGCGFPVDPEIKCSSGGTVLVDLQVTNMNDGVAPVPTVTISGALLMVRRRRCE